MLIPPASIQRCAQWNFRHDMRVCAMLRVILKQEHCVREPTWEKEREREREKRRERESMFIIKRQYFYMAFLSSFVTVKWRKMRSILTSTKENGESSSDYCRLEEQTWDGRQWVSLDWRRCILTNMMVSNDQSWLIRYLSNNWSFCISFFSLAINKSTSKWRWQLSGNMLLWMSIRCEYCWTVSSASQITCRVMSKKKSWLDACRFCDWSKDWISTGICRDFPMMKRLTRERRRFFVTIVCHFSKSNDTLFQIK